MTLVQLSYIVSVDTYRHFANAAEHCFVTQPTLSMQIHKLEDELGVQVFDRTKQPIEPTDIGVKIIIQARTILKESERIQDIIKNETNEISGEFRVGIIPTIAPYLIPLFLKKFTEKYPKLELIIDEIQTSQIMDRLDKDLLDIGILATPLERDHFKELPLYYEPLVGYVPENHRLYKNKTLKANDLSLDDILLLDEGNCFRDQAMMMCQKYRESGSKRNTHFESGNLETLRKLVNQGLGMTLLPSLMVDEFENKSELEMLRYFEGSKPTREISLIYGHCYLKKHIIDAFVSEIKEAVPIQLLTQNDSQILGVIA
jgi:LysR family hydrogen peroxide-inducible transcriptional activator